jgi:hypothetical protein
MISGDLPGESETEVKTLAAAFLLALSVIPGRADPAPTPPSPVTCSQVIQAVNQYGFAAAVAYARKYLTRHQIAKARMCLTQKDSAQRG